MYQSIGIHIDPTDEILPSTSQPTFVSIQIIPPVGGTTTLVFAPADGPAAAVGVIDKLMAALGECRDSLVVRRLATAGLAVATEAETRAEKRRAPHHDFAQRKVSFSLDAPGPLEQRAIDGDR